MWLVPPECSCHTPAKHSIYWQATLFFLVSSHCCILACVQGKAPKNKVNHPETPFSRPALSPLCWGLGDKRSFYKPSNLQDDGYGSTRMFATKEMNSWIQGAGNIVSGQSLPPHNIHALDSCCDWPLCIATSPRKDEVRECLVAFPHLLSKALELAGQTPFVHVKGPSRKRLQVLPVCLA